ncbi:DUF6510 family protein [Micromonospora sp. RHAY321]|uniref:DUF6510 family protein n=1 Tax=unclassified Micromonospora TaxID=2617518 RepID=UPI00207D0A63|nr:DUF6510 family protein [Micromonospora sp. RHAY321]MCO1594294.1 DUF6510 family protein [Micromonospora sp. RHAY321]
MTEMSYLDGNMLDGPLRELFAVDLSTATGRCENCGMTGSMASLRVFSHAPGLIARCPSCEEVMLRLVRGPDRAWLDMRGTTFLQVPMPMEQPYPSPL